MKMNFTDFMAQVGSYEIAEAKGTLNADENEMNFDCLVFDWNNFEFTSGIVTLYLDDGTSVIIRRDRAKPCDDSLLATAADGRVLCKCNSGGAFCEEPVSTKLIWKTKHSSRVLSYAVNNATEIFWGILQKLDRFTKNFFGFRWGIYCIAVDRGMNLAWHIANFQRTGVKNYYECDASLDFQTEPSLHLLVGEKGVVGVLSPLYAGIPLNDYFSEAVFVLLNDCVKAYMVAFEKRNAAQK